jgi:histidinol-phosphate aminotransferase
MPLSTPSTFNITHLVRKNILAMKPYSSARDEFKGEAEVFLDANENPFPTGYNRYPDPLQWAIKEKLATLKQIAPSQIFLGNGSDEAIDLLIRAFCEPHEDAILITEPTYGMYAVCADINAVPVQKVALTGQFDIDEAAVSKAITSNTKLIFLCSPNNPSANLLSRSKVLSILHSFAGLVIVDEAYIDFANAPSFTKELAQHPNLVVLQTFSKAWGLAGLRLGMCFAAEEIISILNKIKYPYNINTKTQELVLEALEREEQKTQWVNEILQERANLQDTLKNLPVVQEIFPSDANFILVKVNDAHLVYQYLMQNKIIVRDRSRVVLCESCLRITVGTPEENKRLAEALLTYSNSNR